MKRYRIVRQLCLVYLLAKGLSMNSDHCHNEAQFHWLRYLLDSYVQPLVQTFIGTPALNPTVMMLLYFECLNHSLF